MKLYRCPSQALYTKCEEANMEKISKMWLTLIDKKLKKAYKLANHGDFPGISLNQLGVFFRAFIMRLDGVPTVIWNPEILEVSEEMVRLREGCLSYPGMSIKKERFSSIKLRYYTTQKEQKEILFSGLQAILVQHEIDHLDGISYSHDEIEEFFRESKERNKQANSSIELECNKD